MPSSDRIIDDIYRALEVLLIVFRENGAAVEGLAGKNGHRSKQVGEGKIVICAGARTKGEGCKYKLAKNMFFHSDLLQLCLKKKCKITNFFPDTTVLFIKHIVLQTNEIKIQSTINQSYCIIHSFYLR